MELQELFNNGEGYLPLVLTQEWQLAQLNTCPSQYPQNITMLDRHDFTDETFTLVKGRAILLTCNNDTTECFFTAIKPFVTYNIPTMMWHNIAMDKDTIVMITEGRDAHLKGFQQVPLPKPFYDDLQKKAKKIFS